MEVFFHAWLVVFAEVGDGGRSTESVASQTLLLEETRLKNRAGMDFQELFRPAIALFTTRKAVSLALGFPPSSSLCSSHPQMAQRKIRDILAQVKQQHQKGQSGQTQARRK